MRGNGNILSKYWTKASLKPSVANIQLFSSLSSVEELSEGVAPPTSLPAT